MSDLEKRLQQAIDRGQKSRDDRGSSENQNLATEADLKTRHSELRLALSEHVEAGLRSLRDHFPGFDYETVMNEDGWGARISRDDINLNKGVSRNLYSRLEVLVKPFSNAHILEIVTKGTIRNKEAVNRNNFRFLKEATIENLKELVDNVLVEFAEKYAAQG